MRTVPAMVRELAARVDAAARLAGDERTALGAAALATVAAYLLAAREAAGEAAHADKVAALRGFVASTEPAHRSFRATLIDAALRAEGDARIARGAPILGRRSSDWMDAPASGPAPSATAGPTGEGADPSLPPSVVEACAEAAALSDVNIVLMRTLSLTRAMRIAAERGERREHLLDDYERAALALCVEPPAPGAVDDARWLVAHHWSVLRRRRPLAAAVVRGRARWAVTRRRARG